MTEREAEQVIDFVLKSGGSVITLTEEDELKIVNTFRDTTEPKQASTEAPKDA